MRYVCVACAREKEREKLIEKAMTNDTSRVHWRQSMRDSVGDRPNVFTQKAASLHLINISLARNITAAWFKNRPTFYTESPRRYKVYTPESTKITIVL